MMWQSLFFFIRSRPLYLVGLLAEWVGNETKAWLTITHAHRYYSVLPCLTQFGDTLFLDGCGVTGNIVGSDLLIFCCYNSIQRLYVRIGFWIANTYSSSKLRADSKSANHSWQYYPLDFSEDFFQNRAFLIMATLTTIKMENCSINNINCRDRPVIVQLPSIDLHWLHLEIDPLNCLH